MTASSPLKSLSTRTVSRPPESSSTWRTKCATAGAPSRSTSLLASTSSAGAILPPDRSASAAVHPAASSDAPMTVTIRTARSLLICDPSSCPLPTRQPSRWGGVDRVGPHPDLRVRAGPDGGRRGRRARDGGRRSRRGAELREDPADVGLHRLGADAQQLAQRPVGPPLGHQGEHLTFPGGEVVQRVVPTGTSRGAAARCWGRPGTRPRRPAPGRRPGRACAIRSLSR